MQKTQSLRVPYLCAYDYESSKRMDQSENLLAGLMGMMAGSMMSPDFVNHLRESNSVDTLQQHKNNQQKKLQLLEAILEELKAIRQDTAMVKEAILFNPDGPGAAAAKDHFHNIL